MMPKEIVEAALTIHRTVCKDFWDYCLEEHGYCVRVATKVYHEGKLKPTGKVSTMSKNIVEIHKELSKLKRELEQIPSANVRLLVGVIPLNGPRYAPVSEVRQALNEAWTLLNRVTNLLDDMEAL